MKDKTVVITGATNGIGLETARELARMGASVHLVGRDPARLEEAITSIRATSGDAKLHAYQADLSRQSEVRRLAAELKAALPRIDALINNAGALFMKRQESADGIELTWALNHLAYFLLTNLLLDTVKAAPGARIVNVSSAAHVAGRIAWDDIDLKNGRYAGFRAYAQSKMANIMFTFALARRLEGTGVTANAVHPGGVATGFAKNNGGVYRILMSTLARPFMRTPAQGAQTSIYVASAPDVQGISGKYFADRKPVEPDSAAKVEADQERLWSVSLAQTGG